MTESEKPGSQTAASVALLLLSAAILLLEVGQVRVFSYILWHHVTYLVVTVTLLGFAAGGTAMAVLPGRGGVWRSTSASLLFGLLSLLTFGVMARHQIELLPEADVSLPALRATLHYLYLVVPFFFAGMGVAAALDGDGPQVSRRYAVNMIGSAAGCLLATPVLRAFGGGGVVLATAALTFLAAFFFARAAGRRVLATSSLGLCVLAGLALPWADSLLPFPVAAGKTLDMELRKGVPLIATYWDPICRIDVVGDEAGRDALHVYQDGDAPTWIPSKHQEEGAFASSHLALAYMPKLVPGTTARRDKALVIGVGGGHDIRTALVMGATRVVGAEINASTAEMMRDRFSDYSGGLYSDLRVEIIVADGRSVVARSDEKFDVIQITGADTYAALASGANLVAESYLYTQDALDDYMEHLTDQGMLAVLRWRFRPPRESLRLVGMAALALKKLGVEDPSKHIAVVNVDSTGSLFDGHEVQARYAVTLVKRTPLTDGERAQFRRFAKEHPTGNYSIAYLPGDPSEPEFEGYLGAIREGDAAQRAFEDAYAYAIDPVSDDRPFFFQFFRGRDVVGDRAEEKGKEHFWSVIGLGPAGLQVLWYSMAAAVLLVILLVIAPLVVFRRSGLAVPGGGRLVVFFIAVGLAYLMVEIATMQRLTLYLGHPLFALSLGLTTFLVGSGLGAAWSARIAEGSERKGAAIGALVVVVLLAFHAFGVPKVLEATLDLSTPARATLAVLMIAPLAFFMGFPFPLGLRRARAQAPRLLPWAFGVNGGASVIASVLAILFAMDYGFAAVLLFGAGLYLLASLALPKHAPS